MKRLMTLSLALFAFACQKKSHDLKAPQRLDVDAMSPSAIMQDASVDSVQQQLSLWLKNYPAEINRVLPESASTVLGLAVSRYYQSEKSTAWLAVIEQLLSQGADPNVELTHQGVRQPLLHLTVEQSDLSMLAFLVEQQGTREPPLRLSCDTSSDFVAPAQQKSAFPLDLNKLEAKSGRSALHVALGKATPDLELIRFLLLQGANPRVTGADSGLLPPAQLALSVPSALPLFEQLSGEKIRFDARLNALINSEIEKAPAARSTILDLAKSYKTLVEQENLQSVQDINRTVELCQSGEKMNLLTYSVQYLLPSISTRAPIAAKTRNDSISKWLKEYGASVCLAEKQKIRGTVAGEWIEASSKDLLKASLQAHTLQATPAVQKLNLNLWCGIIRESARQGGCWSETEDSVLTSDLLCEG